MLKKYLLIKNHTVQEKLLLIFFLMDHGVKITQGFIKKGAFDPDLWGVRNESRI